MRRVCATTGMHYFFWGGVCAELSDPFCSAPHELGVKKTCDHGVKPYDHGVTSNKHICPTQKYDCGVTAKTNMIIEVSRNNGTIERSTDDQVLAGQARRGVMWSPHKKKVMESPQKKTTLGHQKQHMIHGFTTKNGGVEIGHV